MWAILISNATELLTGLAWTGLVAYFSYKFGVWRGVRSTRRIP